MITSLPVTSHLFYAQGGDREVGSLPTVGDDTALHGSLISRDG